MLTCLETELKTPFCVEKVLLPSYAVIILWSYLHLTSACSGKQYCGPLDIVIYSYFLDINFPDAWNRLALGSVTFLCPEQE